MNFTLGVVILGILILLSGTFSGIEAAYLSFSNIQVRRLVKKKTKNAHLIKKLKDDSHKLIIMLLIGNNLVNIGASAIATSIAIDLWQSKGVGIATGIMTFMVLIFGEIVPKSKAMQHSEKICLLSARPLLILKTLLYPLIVIFEFITKRLVGSLAGSRPLITEEELKSFVEIGEEAGQIEKDEKEMIHNIFKLNDLEVHEIMTPKIKMVILDQDHTLKQELKVIISARHSRIPLYDGNREHIVGVLNIKHVLRYLKDQKLNVKLKDLGTEPLIVPETKLVDDLLKEMQKKIIQIAIVIDEYGSVMGLVTIEDILEEIVGEIYDESDIIEKEIVKIDMKTARVQGETSIEHLNKQLRTQIEVTNDYNTISGYILKELGRIPEQGEELDLPLFTCRVEKITNNRIVQVKITKK